MTKCVHSPRRVPGSRQACRSCDQRLARAHVASRGGHAGGVATARTADADGDGGPDAARDEERRATSPPSCSSATSGTAAAICPNWPRMPVSCVISGARWGGNHSATSRSTLMNVIASPAPTSTRPEHREPDRVRGRQDELPDRHHERADDDQPPRADAVEHDADRDLQARRRPPSWSTLNRLRTAALAPKRRCASTPATPSDARWKTATDVGEQPDAPDDPGAARGDGIGDHPRLPTRFGRRQC